MTSPRDRVVDATMSLAARREFGDVTLTEIAREAGMSLADLRDLYPSKGAILGSFHRRIDREVLDAFAVDSSSEPSRERLYAVLSRRLRALEPYREAIASISRWAARDPISTSAVNREVVNSMRYMLEAADVDCDGPLGSLKLQGLAFAWGRVINDWIDGDMHSALATVDRELARGEWWVDQAEDLARWTRPFQDIATRLFDWGTGARGGARRRRDFDDEWPHSRA